mgnify:CR=1 FL=1
MTIWKKSSFAPAFGERTIGNRSTEWMNNCYYVRYVEENKMEDEKKIVDTIEKEIMKEFEKEIEIEITIDEDGNIIEENEK